VRALRAGVLRKMRGERGGVSWGALFGDISLVWFSYCFMWMAKAVL
jgi:hypothetical protein